MQEKEPVMLVWFELKIPSLGITVQHHSASLVMPNRYPRDRIFKLNLTTIKDSYNLILVYTAWQGLFNVKDSSGQYWYLFFDISGLQCVIKSCYSSLVGTPGIQEIHCDTHVYTDYLNNREKIIM